MNVDYDYVLIGCLLTGLAIFAGWMFVTAKVHWSIKCAGALFAVLMAFSAWWDLTNIMGYGTFDEPPDHALVLAHVASKQKKVEYVWAIDGKHAVKGPKTYIMPLHEERSKQVDKALNEARKEGFDVHWHRAGKPGNGKGKGQGRDGKRPGEGDGTQVGGVGQATGPDGTQFGDQSQGSNVQVTPQLPDKDQLKQE